MSLSLCLSATRGVGCQAFNSIIMSQARPQQDSRMRGNKISSLCYKNCNIHYFFTSDCKWILSWTSLIQFQNPIHNFKDIFHKVFSSQELFSKFYLRIFDQNFVHNFYPSHASYILCQSHSPPFLAVSSIIAHEFATCSDAIWFFLKLNIH